EAQVPEIHGRLILSSTDPDLSGPVDRDHAGVGVVGVEPADDRLHGGPAALEILGELVVPGQYVHEDVVHPARAAVVQEPDPFQAGRLPLRLHVPGLFSGQIIGGERPPAPSAFPLHRAFLKVVRQGLRSPFVVNPGWGVAEFVRIQLAGTLNSHEFSYAASSTGIAIPMPARPRVRRVSQKLRALRGTAGSSATLIQMCTCGWPRKYHTNAGPSSRQLSHSPSFPRSPSL